MTSSKSVVTVSDTIRSRCRFTGVGLLFVPPLRPPSYPTSLPAVRLPSASVLPIDQSVAQSNARQVKRRLPGQRQHPAAPPPALMVPPESTRRWRTAPVTGHFIPVPLTPDYRTQNKTTDGRTTHAWCFN